VVSELAEDQREPGSVVPADWVSLPARPATPLNAVAKRALLAVGLLALTAVIVYLGRDGYQDGAHPGQPLSVLAAIYYSAVTLSTTGYGDIVPVTDTARLVQTVLITPIRVVFLIVLVGTTLEVLTERTRMHWRITRWRSKMAGHVIVIGFGSKGRAVARTLNESGTPRESIVVIDSSAEAVAEANSGGLVAVTGDGTRRAVLEQAETQRASQVVIAVHRDDTAVLIALTARQLNPSVTIVAAVRERENQALLRQSGADHVVMSSDAAGQMLAISALRPAAGRVVADLLDHGSGLDLVERSPGEAEVGGAARDAAGTVIAVVREGQILAPDHPAAARLASGDRLILISSRDRSPTTG
jgi:voltage-gated potassium channel